MNTADYIKNKVDIVEYIGRFVALKKQGSDYKGCCPFHEEKTGSFNVNQNTQTFKCFGCDVGGDVIDFVQKQNNIDFKAAVEIIGAEIEPGAPKKSRAKKKKAEKLNLVTLSYEAAKDHYTPETMQAMADFIFKDDPHDFKEAWAYKNETGDVDLVVARFENTEGKKSVLSMYWNGKRLKMKGYPVLLFNRDRLANETEKPVLIVEGEKSAKAAAALTDFVPVTWNGGGAKSKDVDWALLKNREVFIYPDDDQKKYKDSHPRAGQLLPPNEQPGNKAAAQIQKKLPQAKIVKPLPEARKIKPSGADIVEALEVLKPDKLSRYIYENAERNEVKNEFIEQETTTAETPSNYPFQVLGVADDGKAYFIGQSERMYALNPLSFTKTQLFNLADITWWRNAYDGSGSKEWEQAISDIVMASNETDFDPDKMRGRGAWRENDGRICYHDGKTPIGEYSAERIYLRRSVKDIGISSKLATREQRLAICEAAKELTFETLSDCVRTLGWAVLAPFAGALPWRPAGLLTAASGTGKSTIVTNLIKPLANPIICSGGESTAAGIRQRIGVDSCAIVVEEAETDTQKKKQNRDETFSLMRQSTSDDSPDVLKGTIDGRGLSFTLRSMFFFVSISPEVECEADENRIFRISLRKANYKRRVWLDKERQIKNSLTPEICKNVRAYTWKNLPAIITLAERVATKAQLTAGADNRTAFAESLLIAAYIAVFKDKPDPSNIFITDFVKEFYALTPLEKRRNENEEMLDILLDSIIRDGSDNFTIREILNAIKTGKIYCEELDLIVQGEEKIVREEKIMQRSKARRLAGMYGLGLAPDGNIAIAKNHKEIMRLLDKGKGYQMQLMRHPRIVAKSKNVTLGSGNTKNCVVIEWEQG